MEFFICVGKSWAAITEPAVSSTRPSVTQAGHLWVQTPINWLQLA